MSYSVPHLQKGSCYLICVWEDWGDGMCWVGGWCLLHLVLLQGHVNGVGVIPNKVAWGMQESPWILCLGSCLGEIDLVDLLLAVMLMRMTCQGLPSLRVGSPSSHGGGWSPMRWMGSQNISHTQGQTYNDPSRGDWWMCPPVGPPSCTKGSGSPYWSGIVCPDHVCPSGPLPLGTPMGVPT